METTKHSHKKTSEHKENRPGWKTHMMKNVSNTHDMTDYSQSRIAELKNHNTTKGEKKKK